MIRSRRSSSRLVTAPRLPCLAALFAAGLLATGCMVIATPRYRQEWGPKPKGPMDACPALSGTYDNTGETALHCQWLVPIPLPLGCSHDHDGRFHRGLGDSFRIEMKDSESVRITVLSGERVVVERTLHREKEDFRCDDGSLTYWEEGPDFEHSLSRGLSRASDGSLLMLEHQDINRVGPYGFGYYFSGYFWSRHRERPPSLESP